MIELKTSHFLDLELAKLLIRCVVRDSTELSKRFVLGQKESAHNLKFYNYASCPHFGTAQQFSTFFYYSTLFSAYWGRKENLLLKSCLIQKCWDAFMPINYEGLGCMPKILDLLDCSNKQDRKCWMKCCLIHEMLRCIYAHLVLEVGQRNLDNSFHISYISIENFWIFVISYLKVSYFYLHISALSLSRWLLLQAHSSSCSSRLML